MDRPLIANLDVEARLAGRPLGRPLRTRLAALGTLLRVFASDDDDTLVLLEPLAADRLSRALDLPLPRLAVHAGRAAPHLQPFTWSSAGQRREQDLHASALAAVTALPAESFDAEATPLAREDLSRLVARCAPAPARVAALALHRSFGLALAARLGAALPGARSVASLAELDAWIAAEHASVSHGAWIAKHPLSAAGRQRLQGCGAPSPLQRRQLLRLLGSGEPLLLEPWHERHADFGRAGWVDVDGRVALLPPHRQRVTTEGAFLGIELCRSGCADLLEHEERELWRVGAGVGAALAALGYRGPFGVDAWAYRGTGGARCFQALGELNARCTFGLLAQALASRALAQHPQATRCALRFDAPGVPPDGATSYELLRPAAPDALGAWLTVGPAGPAAP